MIFQGGGGGRSGPLATHPLDLPMALPCFSSGEFEHIHGQEAAEEPDYQL